MHDHPEDDTLSIQIANQVVNIANARTQEGVDPREVAQGLRHAAANFSAFAEQNHPDGDVDPTKPVEEFIQFLEYYLDRHGTKPEDADKPAAGLEELIAQAKNEI